MERAEEFDLFIKVDADMVLAHEHVFRDIIAKFRGTPDLDHYIVGCEDFMTQKRILGLHSFSSRVKWTRTTDGLFLDPSPERPGKRIIDQNPPKPVVFHSPDPSPLQAFHFGTHRALKVT